MKMRSSAFSLLFTAVICALAVNTAFAQTDKLQLSLGKISGFGLGSQIQGLFGLSVSSGAPITSVTFEIDGKEIGIVSQAPFSFQFHTDSYAPGPHRFTATARTATGQQLTSNAIDTEIVSFSQGWTSTARLLWPILLVVGLALLVAIAVPLLSAQSSRHYAPGDARNYGIAGGTICGNCKRPYALSLFSLRLVVGRLARCPFCGKWAIARAASPEALRAAEQAEVANTPTVHEPSAEERLRRQIEDSRMAR